MLSFHVFFQQWFLYTNASFEKIAGDENIEVLKEMSSGPTNQKFKENDLDSRKKKSQEKLMKGQKESIEMSPDSKEIPIINLVIDGLVFKMESIKPQHMKKITESDFYSDFRIVTKVFRSILKTIRGIRNFVDNYPGMELKSFYILSTGEKHDSFYEFAKKQYFKYDCDRLKLEERKTILVQYRFYKDLFNLVSLLKTRNFVNLLVQLITFRMLELKIENGFIEIKFYPNDFIIVSLEESNDICFLSDDLLEDFLFRHKISTNDLEAEFLRFEMGYIRNLIFALKYFHLWIIKNRSKENSFHILKQLVVSIISFGEYLYEYVEELAKESPGMYYFIYINETIAQTKIDKVFEEVKISRDQNLTAKLAEVFQVNSGFNGNDLDKEFVNIMQTLSRS